ncbi:hypothetical protein QHH03_15405, partial [Aphanizomenon sp. 202]|nr:hypothetical protein [Aphanizomenon sp. 202]
ADIIRAVVLTIIRLRIPASLDRGVSIPLKLKRFCLSFLKKTKIGYLPVSIPAGNLAVIGYKK